jgi:hypothetical protein
MKMLAVWTLAIACCLASWAGAFCVGVKAYKKFMAKCEADVRLSENTGRIAAALEYERGVETDRRIAENNRLADTEYLAHGDLKKFMGVR